MFYNFLSAFDLTTVIAAVNDIALYLTITIFALLLIFGVLVKIFRKDSVISYFKSATAGFLGYIVGILPIFFYIKYAEYQNEGYIEAEIFSPIVALFALAAVLAIVGVIIWALKPKALKWYTIASASVVGLYAAVLLIYRMVLDFKSGAFDNKTQVALYLFTAMIVAILLVGSFVFGKKKNTVPTKTIAFAAITMATSFALSYIRFFELPSGGSITLASLLPIMIFAYMFGMRKGLLVGALYGLLQFIQAPWFLHPMQFLLDYPLAFATIAFAALFKELNLFKKSPALQFILGAVVVALVRYFSHVVSGIFVFGSADPSYSAVGWSFFYNTFVFVDMAITVVAGGLLFLSKTFIHQLELSMSGIYSAQGKTQILQKTAEKTEVLEANIEVKTEENAEDTTKK